VPAWPHLFRSSLASNTGFVRVMLAAAQAGAVTVKGNAAQCDFARAGTALFARISGPLKATPLAWQINNDTLC
jgi:hypothetical protein